MMVVALMTKLRPWARAVAAVMHKDLRTEARRGSMIGTWLILGVVVAVAIRVFNGPINLRPPGAGLTVAWLFGALIGTVAIARAYRHEQSLQGWTATLSTSSSPGAVFFGKTAAQVVVTMLALLVAVVAYALLVEWPAGVPLLLAVMFFASLAICGIATMILAAILAAWPGTRGGSFVLLLLATPFIAPVVYLAGEATRSTMLATAELAWSPMLTWLAIYGVVVVAAGTAGFGLIASPGRR